MANLDEDSSWKELENKSVDDDKIKIDNTNNTFDPNIVPLLAQDKSKISNRPKFYNVHFLATNLLLIFFGIILFSGIAIAAVPQWRNATIKYFQQFGPKADTLTPAEESTAIPTEGISEPSKVIENRGENNDLTVTAIKNKIFLPPPKIESLPAWGISHLDYDENQYKSRSNLVRDDNSLSFSMNQPLCTANFVDLMSDSLFNEKQTTLTGLFPDKTTGGNNDITFNINSSKSNANNSTYVTYGQEMTIDIKNAAGKCNWQWLQFENNGNGGWYMRDRNGSVSVSVPGIIDKSLTNNQYVSSWSFAYSCPMPDHNGTTWEEIVQTDPSMTSTVKYNYYPKYGNYKCTSTAKGNAACSAVSSDICCAYQGIETVNGVETRTLTYVKTWPDSSITRPKTTNCPITDAEKAAGITIFDDMGWRKEQCATQVKIDGIGQSSCSDPEPVAITHHAEVLARSELLATTIDLVAKYKQIPYITTDFTDREPIADLLESTELNNPLEKLGSLSPINDNGEYTITLTDDEKKSVKGEFDYANPNLRHPVSSLFIQARKINDNNAIDDEFSDPTISNLRQADIEGIVYDGYAGKNVKIDTGETNAKLGFVEKVSESNNDNGNTVYKYKFTPILPDQTDGKTYTLQLDNNGFVKDNNGNSRFLTYQSTVDGSATISLTTDNEEEGTIKTEVPIKQTENVSSAELYATPYYVSWDGFNEYMASAKLKNANTSENIISNLTKKLVTGAKAETQEFNIVSAAGNQEKVTDESIQTPLYKYTIKKFSITVPADYKSGSQSVVGYLLLPPGMSTKDIKISPEGKKIKVTTSNYSGYTKVQIDFSDAKAGETYNLEVPFDFKIKSDNAKKINEQVEKQIKSAIDKYYNQFKEINSQYYDDQIKFYQAKIDLLQSIQTIASTVSGDGASTTNSDILESIQENNNELNDFKDDYNNQLADLNKKKQNVLDSISEKNTENNEAISSLQDSDGYIDYAQMENFAAQISAGFSMANIEEIFPFSQINNYVTKQQNDLINFQNSNEYSFMMNSDIDSKVQDSQKKLQDAILVMYNHNAENISKINTEFKNVNEKLDPYTMINRIMNATIFVLDKNNDIESSQIESTVTKIFNNEETSLPTVKNVSDNQDVILAAKNISEVQQKVDSLEGEVINIPLYGAFVENTATANNYNIVNSAQAATENRILISFMPVVNQLNTVVIDNPKITALSVTHDGKTRNISYDDVIDDENDKKTNKIFVGDEIRYIVDTSYYGLYNAAGNVSDTNLYSAPLKNFSADLQIDFNQPIQYRLDQESSGQSDTTKTIKTKITNDEKSTNTRTSIYVTVPTDSNWDYITAKPTIIYNHQDKGEESYSGDKIKNCFFQEIYGKIIGPDGEVAKNIIYIYSYSYYISKEDSISSTQRYARSNEDGEYKFSILKTDDVGYLDIGTMFNYNIDANKKIFISSYSENSHYPLTWRVKISDLRNDQGGARINKDIKIALYDKNTKSFASDPKPVNFSDGSTNLYKKTIASFIENNKLYSYFERLNKDTLLNSGFYLNILYVNKEDFNFSTSNYKTKSSLIELDKEAWSSPEKLISVNKNGWSNNLLAHELTHTLNDTIWQEMVKNYQCLGNNQNCFASNHQGIANDYSGYAYSESLAEYGAKYLEPNSLFYTGVGSYQGKKLSGIYWAIISNYLMNNIYSSSMEDEEYGYSGLYLQLYPITTKVVNISKEQSDINFTQFIKERYAGSNNSINISDYYDNLINNSALSKSIINTAFANAGVCDVNKNGNWVCDKGETIGRPINSKLTFYANKLIHHSDGSKRSLGERMTIYPRSWRRYPVRTDIPLIVNSVGATAKITNSDINESNYYNSYIVANYNIQTDAISDEQILEINNNDELGIDIPKDNNIVVVVIAKGSDKYWIISAKDYWNTVNSSLFAISSIDHSFSLDKFDSEGNPADAISVTDAINNYKVTENYNSLKNQTVSESQKKIDSVNQQMTSECDALVDTHNKEYEAREAAGESEISLLAWREPLFDEENKCYQKYYTQLENLSNEQDTQEQETINTDIDSQVDQTNNEEIVNNDMQDSRDEEQTNAEEEQTQSDEENQTLIAKCQAIYDEYETKYQDLLNKKAIDNNAVTDEELQTVLSEQSQKQQACYDEENATSKQYSDAQITKAANIIYRLQTEQNVCKNKVIESDKEFIANNINLISQVANFSFPKNITMLNTTEPYVSWPDNLKQAVADHENTIQNIQDDCNAEYVSLMTELENIRDNNDKAYFDAFAEQFSNTVEIILDTIKFNDLISWVKNLGNETAIQEEEADNVAEEQVLEDIKEQITDSQTIPDSAEPFDADEAREEENLTEIITDSSEQQNLPVVIPTADVLSSEPIVSPSPSLNPTDSPEITSSPMPSAEKSSSDIIAENTPSPLSTAPVSENKSDNIIDTIVRAIDTLFTGHDDQSQTGITTSSEPVYTANVNSSPTATTAVAIDINSTSTPTPSTTSTAISTEKNSDKTTIAINSVQNSKKQIDSATPGQTIAIASKSFPDSQNIQIFIDDTYVQQTSIPGADSFSIEEKLPLNLKTGEHKIKVIGDAQGEYAISTIYVKNPGKTIATWICCLLLTVLTTSIVAIVLILKKSNRTRQNFIITGC